MSAKEVVDSFDPEMMVSVAGGKKLRVQDLVDRLARAENDLRTRGSSLTRVPRRSALGSATTQKKAAQHAGLASEIQAARMSVSGSVGVRDSVGCTADTCRPTGADRSVSWGTTKGDEDVAAAYTSFSVRGRAADAYTAGCEGTWDNGVYLVGRKASVLKFVTQATSSRRPSPSLTATASLYVLGQATPVWQKNGRIDGEALDRTFGPPPVGWKQPIVPSVAVEGELGAAATLAFRPSVEGSAGNEPGVRCGLGLTPRLAVQVTGKASVVIGIPDLMELAEGGIKGTLGLVDVRVPTTLTLGITQAPLAGTLRLKSDVDTRFLTGKIVAFYKLADICLFGKCLVEDGLGIPTEDEIEIWSDDEGLRFGVPLADVSAPLGFARN